LKKSPIPPENIAISFFDSQNPQDFGETQNLAPHLRGGAKPSPQSFSADRRKAEKELVSPNMARLEGRFSNFRLGGSVQISDGCTKTRALHQWCQIDQF
jgi:hypothetical protein